MKKINKDKFVELREKILQQGSKYASREWNVLDNPNEHDRAHDDFIAGALWLAKNHGVSHHVSASTVKALHTALTNLLQATDDEGWNNDGEDWEEQLEARMALAQTPKEYLR